MLKENAKLISGLERVGDNLLIIAAFFISYTLRDYFIFLSGINAPLTFGLDSLPVLGAIENYFLILAVALPLFNFCLHTFGGYRSLRLSSSWAMLRATFLSALIVFLVEGWMLYWLKLQLSRSFLVIFCVSSGLVLFLERYLILISLKFIRVRGKNFRNVLIVGTGQQARQLYKEIISQPELGWRVVGFVSNGEEEEESFDQNFSEHIPVEVIATVETFEKTLKKHATDEVIFTDVFQTMDTVKYLSNIAVEEGVGVTLAADLFSLGIVHASVSYFGSVPLVHYNTSPTATVPLFLKRSIDILVSGLGLILLSPLMLIVGLAIIFDSPGTIFFRQKRVGLNGRVFTLYKFRSMGIDAEKELGSLKEKNEMSGPVFKIREDPRITRVGKILRRYSIDELPQLLNVLLGEMSLVGPRPPLPEEVSSYIRRQRRRLSMRPGITCIWQVSGRNEIKNFEDWSRLDLEYIDNWSLLLDFKLLLRTIPAVIFGSGAR